MCAMSSSSASWSLSPVEHVLLAVLAAAGAAGIVVWGGASASTFVSGHGRLAVGIGDALRAIPGLVESPGSPSNAWPTSVGDRIATAPIYWLATGTVLV